MCMYVFACAIALFFFSSSSYFFLINTCLQARIAAKQQMRAHVATFLNEDSPRTFWRTSIGTPAVQVRMTQRDTLF